MYTKSEASLFRGVWLSRQSEGWKELGIGMGIVSSKSGAKGLLTVS